MREKGQTEAAKTLETPVFSRGIEILTEKFDLIAIASIWMYRNKNLRKLSKSPRESLE